MAYDTKGLVFQMDRFMGEGQMTVDLYGNFQAEDVSEGEPL